MTIEKYSQRSWAVYDNAGELVCITVYKKGALEVVRRLESTCNDTSTDTITDIKKLLCEIKKSYKHILKLASQFNI